jgi:hypothetical protein
MAALHCGSAHDVHIQEKNGLTCNNAALIFFFFFFFLRRSKLNFPYILTTQPKYRDGRQPRALDMRAFLTWLETLWHIHRARALIRCDDLELKTGSCFQQQHAFYNL